MYFFKLKGRQVLDLRGDLVITHNDALIKGRVKSAAPSSVQNAKYIELGKKTVLFRRVRATYHAVLFIWGDSEALSKGGD